MFLDVDNVRVWGTRSPTHPQVTLALFLRLYKQRWGLDSFHSVNSRAKVVAQIGGRRFRRAMRLTWISRCESKNCNLEAPRYPRATLQQVLGYRRSPGKGRRAGYARSVIRRSAVRATPSDMKTRPTGGRYTPARCAIVFVVAETRCAGTLGISTKPVPPHWSQQTLEDTSTSNAPDSSHQRT